MKYALWITDPDAAAERTVSPAPLTFRKKFEAGPNVSSAALTVTAMGIYTVLLNGKRAEDWYFAPYFTDYRSRLQYQTLDVTALLAEHNEFEITVGAGWAVGRYGVKDKPGRYEKRPALLAELYVTYDDGTSMWIPTDTSWEVTDSGRYRFADWYDGETYDATVDYDAIPWTRAAVARLRSTPELVAQYGETVRAHEVFRPVNHFTTASGDIIYDFGQNIAGVISAEMNVRKGQTVTFRHAEELYKGELFTLPLHAGQTATYICAGGKETYSPRLTYMGFRYVSVSGIAPEDITVTATVLYSDCPESGRFSCSDRNLEKLQQAIVRTARSNTVDIPTDGCARGARLGRPEIAALAAPTLSFLYKTDKFFGKWLEDLSSEQNRQGFFPESIPSAGAGPTLCIASGDASVLVTWAEYLARGDHELLERQYPAVTNYLNAAAALARLSTPSSPKYILPSPAHPGDVGAPGRTAREWAAKGDLIGTAYLANSCRIAAKMAVILGKTDDAEKYNTLFAEISEAYLAHFTDGAGTLQSESQAGYALPLYFGMVSGDVAAAMAKNLARLTEDEDRPLSCGFFAAPYVLFALADNGYVKEAYRLLFETSRPAWLYELEKGATTLWEYFDTVTPEGRYNLNPEKRASYSPAEIEHSIYMGTGLGKASFNHPAGIAVGEFLYRRVAGLEPLEGGYRKVLIKPLPGAGLSEASASVGTPTGTASVSWRVEHAFFILNADLPEGTSAEVHLPDGTVTEVGSGSHEFRIIASWRKYRISENENREIARMIKEGLKEKDGYCPCRIPRTPENKCMCKEFRDQLKDPAFEGLCHCKLYKKTYEDYQGDNNG